MDRDFGSAENWQKHTTYRWVQRFAEDPSLPRVIVFEGQFNLDFAIEACSEYGIENYGMVVATVPDHVMANRLIRMRDQPELVTEDMRRWSRFLREQGETKGALILDTSAVSTEDAIVCLARLLVGLVQKAS